MEVRRVDLANWASGLHRNSPQGLNISSIRVFDQIGDPEIPITLLLLPCHNRINLMLWGRWSEWKLGEWAELILKAFSHVTYVTAHSPTLPSLYLRHSSFSNPSVASRTSQLILQPFFRFSYVTGFSLTSPGEPPKSTVGYDTQDPFVIRHWWRSKYVVIDPGALDSSCRQPGLASIHPGCIHQTQFLFLVLRNLCLQHAVNNWMELLLIFAFECKLALVILAARGDFAVPWSIFSFILMLPPHT